MKKTWGQISADIGKVKDYQADNLFHSNPMKHHMAVTELIEQGEIKMNYKECDNGYKVYY